MLYIICILCFGIGIGYSISSSTTIQLDNVKRTEFIRTLGDYNTGWRYDVEEVKDNPEDIYYNHTFSLKLFRSTNHVRKDLYSKIKSFVYNKC